MELYIFLAVMFFIAVMLMLAYAGLTLSEKNEAEMNRILNRWPKVK